MITKRILLPFIFILMIAACKMQKPVTKVMTPEITPEDSTQYELVVLDSGFDNWYVLKNSPAQTRNVEYYKSWNSRYVDAWNYGTVNGEFIGSQIDYDRNENYPLEIEQKLYYYFQYVENVLKIPILNNRAKIFQ